MTCSSIDKCSAVGEELQDAPDLLENHLASEKAMLHAAMQTLPAELSDAAYQARLTALNEQLSETEAKLPALNAKVTQITAQHQAASALFLKRMELKKAVKSAQEWTRVTHQKMLDLALARCLDIDTAVKLEDATESYNAAAAKLAALSADLTAFVGPEAEEILSLTRCRDHASIELMTAKGSILLTRNTIETLTQDYKEVKALWACTHRRIDDANNSAEITKESLEHIFSEVKTRIDALRLKYQTSEQREEQRRKKLTAAFGATETSAPRANYRLVSLVKPYEYIRANYRLPFDLYPFQQNAVNALAPLPRTGLYFEPGLGKTATSTVCALYHLGDGAEVVLVLVPPIIIPTWARWLARIRRSDGTSLKVLAYEGSPTRRKSMNFAGQDFILMSMQIFKRDYERVCWQLGPKRVHVILDEAQCIKGVGTQNYKMFRDFVGLQSHQLLTGTPLSNPMDAFAYVKLNAPSVYLTLAQFERIHVSQRDVFNKPTAYQNLDLLKENLLINADRKTKEDVLIDLPECIIVPLEYELAPQHQKLYKRLVNEQLLKFSDGETINATQASALYHALGRIVMQWSHYGHDESLKSAGYEVVEEVLEELGDKKLIVFGNYKRTNAELVRRFNCPGIWGEISATTKQEALDEFIENPKCRMIVLHPQAGGVGVDGLQRVCSDVLYVEPPMAVSHLTQSLSRVHRDGQKHVVTIRLATALGTIQQHLVRSLSSKEALVNPLQGSRSTLRAAFFGER